MTPKELIEAVKVAGGSLTTKGEKLCCEVPRKAAHLIPELRTQKPAVIELLHRRGVPFPGYNDDQPFVCQKCGLHFDTGAGIAKHQVYECAQTPATRS